MTPLSATFKAVSHYIDQPYVVAKVRQHTAKVAAGLAVGYTGWHAYKTPDPAQRKNIVLRDLLVLGATAIGTTLATKKWVFPDKLTPALMTKLKASYKPVAWYKNLIATTPKEKLKDTLSVKLDSASLSENIKDMASFIAVGSASVLSGMAGGLLHNKLKDRGAQATLNDSVGLSDNQIKRTIYNESLFQWAVNISLCTIGVGMGLIASTSKPVAEFATKLGRFGKALPFASMVAGLAGGMVVGSRLVDRYGQQVLDKLSPQTATNANGNGKRKIEFMDALLHLDDMPIALAIAGVQVFKPLVPLLFAISGYRAGIGYRNDNQEPQRRQQVQSAFQSVAQQSQRQRNHAQQSELLLRGMPANSLSSRNNVFAAMASHQKG